MSSLQSSTLAVAARGANPSGSSSSSSTSSSSILPGSTSSSSSFSSVAPDPSSSCASVVTSTHLSIFPFPFYERFVLSHHSWYLSFIDTLRSLTLFLPGRFSSSELRLETFYCFLNFLSYYHEKILEKPLTTVRYELKIENEMKFYEMLMQKQEKKEEETIFQSTTAAAIASGDSKSSSSSSSSASNSTSIASSTAPSAPNSASIFALNFQFLQQKVRNIERCKSVLSLLSYSEVLFELCCNHLPEWFPNFFSAYSDGQKFRIKFLLLFLLEAAKGGLKYYLLKENSGKMLVPYTEQEIIRLWLFRQFKKRLAAKERESNPDSTNKTGPPTDKLITYIEDHLCDAFSLYALHGRYAAPHGKFIFETKAAALPQFPLPPPVPLAISARAAHDERLAELLHIFRPAVYCFLRFLFDPSDDDSSWIPWLSSLSMDVLWRGLYGNISTRPLEQQAELKRRMLFFVLYAARAPFFQSFTKSPLEKISEWSNNVPIMGFVFSNFINILLMLQRHYFYTAAS